MRLFRASLWLFSLMHALPAAGQSLPPRKPGLWDMKLTFGPGSKPYAVKHCVDAATDWALGPLVYPIGNRCSPLQVNRAGADLGVEWTCNDTSETTTRGVVSGSFDSAYTVAMKSRVKNDSNGRVLLTPSGPVYESGPFDEEQKSALEATWLGPCEAGQRPGDVIWPDGSKTRFDG